MNLTKEVINTKYKGFLMKLGIYIKAFALNKIDMTHLVNITIGLRYQRDP